MNGEILAVRKGDMKMPWKFFTALTSVAAAIVLIDGLFLEKYFFKLKRFIIGNQKSHRFIKIMLITDLHFKQHFLPRHKKLVRTINSIQPEILLIGGDIVDKMSDPASAGVFLRSLDSSITKIAIPGNHEHADEVNFDRLKRILTAADISLLMDETLAVNFGEATLHITGLDDSLEGYSSLKMAVEGIGREPHHFLLVHSPDQYQKVVREITAINEVRAESNQLSFRYAFAGHTHGGQIGVGSFRPLLWGRGRFVNGWYNKKMPPLYVSKGFGTTHIPLRIGARAEVILFEYGI